MIDYRLKRRGELGKGEIVEIELNNYSFCPFLMTPIPPFSLSTPPFLSFPVNL